MKALNLFLIAPFTTILVYSRWVLSSTILTLPHLDYNPILPIPELCPPRKKYDQARLRELRKKLESHSASLREVEQIFAEVIEDADDLCSGKVPTFVVIAIVLFTLFSILFLRLYRQCCYSKTHGEE